MADAVARLVDRTRDAERRVRDLQRELLPTRVDQMLADADVVDGVRVLTRAVPVEAKDDLTRIGRCLAGHDGLVAVLASARNERPGDDATKGKGQLLCVVRGPSLDARDVVRRALEPVGGSGGGTADVAQGGFPDPVDQEGLLRAASAVLQELLRGREA